MDVAKKSKRIVVVLATVFTLMIAVWAMLSTTKVYATEISGFEVIPGSGVLIGTGNWESENNDSTGKADSISVGSTYYGNMDGEDEDYYKFTIATEGYVKLVFNHDYITNADTCWNVSLLHSDGSVITTKYVRGNDGSIAFSPVGLSTGTYFVQVHNEWPCGGNSDATYSIKATFAASSVWETEYNDSTAIADPISVNTTYYGNMRDLGGSDEEDYYTFRTTKNGHIKLTFTHDYISNADTCWNVSLLHSDGSVITTKYVKGNDGNITFSPIGLPAGTYFVRVHNEWPCGDNSDATYSIKATFIASSVWETEYNDSTAIADPISVNTTYYGNMRDLDGSDEKDYYSFRTSTRGYVKVSFNHTYVSSVDTYWNVKLLNQYGDEIVSKQVQGNKKSIVLTSVAIPAGTYYVEIDNEWPIGGNSYVNYNFKVNFASDLKLSLPATKYSYTGKERKPKVTVKYGGAALTEGTHYTVSYSNNKYPGTATVTVKGKGKYIGTFKKNFTIKVPVAAQKTVSANLYGYDDFLVKWSGQKVSGHTVKYKVQYKKYGGSWATLLSKTTKTSLKKVNLADGTRYAFKVTPYVTINGKNYYASSKSTPYTYTLKKVSTPKVSRADSRYVRVKWANISGESGYQVYRSKYSNKNFVKVKTISSKYSSAKIKTTRNKTYYYKVRAYKTVDGKKICGPWSSVKKYKLR